MPILFGRDLLDKYQLIPDNTNNSLIHQQGGWSLPLVRRKGHLYLTWNFSEILFTRSEVQKFHLHFFHPSFRKLFNLIMRADYVLKSIQDSCKTCKRLTMKPRSFQVSMPDGVIFNTEVVMDLMFINQTPILHVVDIHTNVSGAEILQRQNIEHIWYAF